ncbi:energy-coupling factor transporter transmembrane protein EcfT [symbiont of Argiope bruennichi]|uniref:energy-coupling factor transporter transmembrane component T family protein n=1 Tax=symbiont of Argiope bruennichi TaxID=2810479 RepID=UPI003DA5F53F
MNKFTVGVYVPNNSFIHRLDVRIKLLSLVFIMALVFIYSGIEGYIYLTIFALVVFYFSKLRFNLIFNMLKPIYPMMVFLLLVTVFASEFNHKGLHFTTSDDWLDKSFNIGNFKFHLQSIWRTLYIIWRIFLMMTFTVILSSTSTPVELTLGLESLMKYLKYIKFPVHQVAMIISISLRFIPSLFEETIVISNSQASRGVDFKNGRIREKFKALTSLVIPIFISSFRKADDLANAMEARGYDPYASRTRYRQLKITTRDIFCLLFFSCFFALIICTNLSFKSANSPFYFLKWFDNLHLGEPIL